MLIRLGYDIQFETIGEVPIVTLLEVHPSRKADLREPDEVRVEPALEMQKYQDSFGNHSCRLIAPGGKIRFHNSTLIEDSGRPDEIGTDARELAIAEMPLEVLPYLLNSRYCEVDLLANTAVELFGSLPLGWKRVQAICDWIHDKVQFGYRIRKPSSYRAGNLYRAGWGMPGFSASGDHVLPRPEYSSALCDRISGRYWRAGGSKSDGLQRLVRSLFGRSLVDL